MTFNGSGSSALIRPEIMSSASPGRGIGRSGQRSVETTPSYPMPAYLNFAPGGVGCATPSSPSTAKVSTGDVQDAGNNPAEPHHEPAVAPQQSISSSPLDDHYYDLTAYSFPDSSSSPASGRGRIAMGGNDNHDPKQITTTESSQDEMVYKAMLADD